MRFFLFILLGSLTLCTAAHAQEQDATVYVDKQGIMRWSHTRKEASFYGVNYTLPFAHAYRAMNYLGVDHKEAIDRDVYHFSRLGFNAYRIHIWDVEISDKQGNLLENDHLDLLDYLIYKLKERGIKVVMTAMTNFGNGYPERNQTTEGFSYLYDKCKVHDDPEAIGAQERYIAQLISHRNPYTGKAYKEDPVVVGFEINNEPCHSVSPENTKRYIDTMLAVIKKTGNKKPVFYNVSHNRSHVESYYATSIQGTTYQWYPIGLVAGHTREGNFLPYVDDYAISFNQVKGFDNKAKLIYEYDPADVTYSYIHPAMVRTFRSSGFQWVTQFAYDPIDMAGYNTEYQTHFVNLAYTPQKAISLKIAAEAMQVVPLNKSYPRFPNDTVFENIRVSYTQDVSELNRADKFYYSNHTHTKPVAPEKLQSIAGYGNSPLITYEGQGAYFLDKLEDGLWRLEVMPDAVPVSDPFAKPSLKKEVVTVLWNQWNMKINLPSLSEHFTVTSLNESEKTIQQVTSGLIKALTPGVYLLQRKGYSVQKEWNASTQWGTIRLGEYVAPKSHAKGFSVFHSPALSSESGKSLTLTAQIAGPSFPDSVIVYTDKISFWNDKNPYYLMTRTSGYTYETTIPAKESKEGEFKYQIVVCHDGTQYTFPEEKEGSPLDWDFSSDKYWKTELVSPESEIRLFSVSDTWSQLDSYCIPEWHQSERTIVRKSITGEPQLRFAFESKENSPRFYLQKYIKEEIRHRKNKLSSCRFVCLHIQSTGKDPKVGLITNQGFTYATSFQLKEEIVRIPVSSFVQSETALLPHPYPVFLKRYFNPEVQLPFRLQDIEKIEVSVAGEANQPVVVEIGSIWFE